MHGYFLLLPGDLFHCDDDRPRGPGVGHDELLGAAVQQGAQEGAGEEGAAGEQRDKVNARWGEESREMCAILAPSVQKRAATRTEYGKGLRKNSTGVAKPLLAFGVVLFH